MARTRVYRRVSRYEDRWVSTFSYCPNYDWGALDGLSKSWGMTSAMFFLKIDRAREKRQEDKDYIDWATRGGT